MLLRRRAGRKGDEARCRRIVLNVSRNVHAATSQDVFDWLRSSRRTSHRAMSDTPHAQVLLPVLGRSRGKPRSYSCQRGTLDALTVSSHPRVSHLRGRAGIQKKRLMAKGSSRRKNKSAAAPVPVGVRLARDRLRSSRKTSHRVMSETSHAQVLLPVPGRSRGKPRVYSWQRGTLDALTVSSHPRVSHLRGRAGIKKTVDGEGVVASEKQVSSRPGPCRSAACPRSAAKQS
jgi:hypothetical protein